MIVIFGDDNYDVDDDGKKDLLPHEIMKAFFRVLRSTRLRVKGKRTQHSS